MSRSTSRHADRVSLVVVLLLGLGVPLAGKAWDCPQRRPGDPYLAATALWSDARAVRVSGETAIVLFSRGAATFDVSDPEAPELLARFDRLGSPWWGEALEVAGGLTYVGVSGKGLEIYDFSNPFRPVLVGTCSVPGAVWDLTLVGDLAYLACGWEGGIQIVDVSNPTAPELLGGCLTQGGPFAVAISGQHAYCANGVEGLSIVDVSDPRHPYMDGHSYDTYYPPFDVYAEGPFLYTIGSEGEKGKGERPAEEETIWDPSGVSILDISDPHVPVLRGMYRSDQGANRLAIEGELAYVANANGTVSVLDVSDPASPSLMSEIATAGYSYDIHVVLDHAYIASSGGSLVVLDLTAPTAPVLVGRWWESCNAYDISGQDGTVCVADRSFGLHLVDAHNPEDPRVVSHLALPTGPWAVALDGSYAYAAADTSGIFVVDVANPKAPSVVAHTGVAANDLDLDGRYLYAVSRDCHLNVIDINDPLDPVVTGSVELPGSSWSISVRGRFGCLAATGVFYVADLQDPFHPVLRGSLDPGEYLHQVSFDGTYAYASLGNNGLYVIDVSDPDAPSYVTELRFSTNTHGSCVYGSRLYLGAEGLSVIDVSDPDDPVVVGSAWTTGTMHVCADQDLVFTADAGSISVFRAGTTTAAQEAGTPMRPGGPELLFENPVRDVLDVRVRTDGGETLLLELFDVLGRHIALIHDGTISGPEQRFSWGVSSLPSGRYTLRASAAGRGSHRSILVVR